MIALDMSAGTTTNAADAANLRVLGVVQPKQGVSVVGTGAGEIVNVHRGPFAMHNSATHAIAATDVGKVCFVEDDITVSINAGAHSAIAGRILGVFDDEQDNPWVWVEPVSELLGPVAVTDTTSSVTDTAVLAATITNTTPYGVDSSAHMTAIRDQCAENYATLQSLLTALKANGYVK